MLKKMLSILLIVLLLNLGACKMPVEPYEHEYGFQEDFCIGIFAYLELDGDIFTHIPTGDFLDEESIYYYVRNIDKTMTTEAGKYLDELSICYNVNNFNIEKGLECTLYLTHGFKGSLFIYNVYQNDENEVYISDYAVRGIHFTSVLKTRITQNLTARKLIEDEITELSYNYYLDLNIVFVDILEEVIVYEYDNDSNLIKTSIINNNQDEGLNTRSYITDNDCAYIVVEETYRNTDDTISKNRVLYDRGNNIEHKAKFSQGNGLVNTVYIQFSFSDC